MPTRTEHSGRRLMSLLVLSFVICATCAIPPVGSETQQPDLISKTCRSTLHYDVCNITLRSAPQSQTADIYQLTEIAIKLTIAQGMQISSNISSLLDANYLPSYAEQRLKDCNDMYNDAVDSLRQAGEDLVKRSFQHINLLVSAAMTQSTTCEDGFSDGEGYKSPITEDNHYFFVLCSNVLAINALLV